MKNITTIDSAGRFVLPKWIRDKFDFNPGQKIKLIETEIGIVIAPVLPKKRKYIKNGLILSIDTGSGEASNFDFDIENYRKKNINDSIDENWH